MPREQLRHNDFSTGPDPFSGGQSDATAVGEGQVDVICGVYAHNLPLGGMRVRDARDELSERMNIDPEAVAVLDGNEVDEDTVLAEGQTLTFVKHAGEKGRMSWLAPRTGRTARKANAERPTKIAWTFSRNG